MVSKEKYEKATGREPEEGELERCNCNKSGTAGHYMCGWCPVCDLPRQVCGGELAHHFANPEVYDCDEHGHPIPAETNFAVYFGLEAGEVLVSFNRVMRLVRESGLAHTARVFAKSAIGWKIVWDGYEELDGVRP